MTEDEVFDNDDAQNRADDPQIDDDVEFVIDEWELLTEDTNVDPATAAFIFGEGEGDAPDAEASAADPLSSMFDKNAGAAASDSDIGGLDHRSTSEEDALFEDQTELPVNVLGKDRVFSEEESAAWGGEDTELEDLGVEMTASVAEDAVSHADDGMFDMDAEDDLILIESEGEIEDAVNVDELQEASAGLTVDQEINYELGTPDESRADRDNVDPGTDYNTVDFDTEQAEGEWAPVSNDYLEDDDEEHEEEGDEVYEEEEQDFSEYEEVYHDETVAETASEGRRSRMPLVLSLAAVVMIGAAGAFWHFNKDLFGPEDKVEEIDVVKIDRPKPGGETAVKDPIKDPVKDPGMKTDPVAKDPETNTDPVAKDPETNTDPVAKDPETNTDPVAKDPETNTDPVAADRTKDPIQTFDPNLRPDGETLRVGGMDEETGSESLAERMERHRREMVQNYNGIEMGMQALAQLRNENIFVGKVKALNSSYVTLSTKAGEVTLEWDNLRALTTLEGDELDLFKNATTTGLIKLRNSNRLKGKIVEARDDSVILMVNANRVIIPKSAIESVSEERKGVNTVPDEAIESDDWFRQLVEKKIKEHDESRRKRSSEIKAQATTTSPTLDFDSTKAKSKKKPAKNNLATPPSGLDGPPAPGPVR